MQTLGFAQTELLSNSQAPHVVEAIWRLASPSSKLVDKLKVSMNPRKENPRRKKNLWKKGKEWTQIFLGVAKLLKGEVAELAELGDVDEVDEVAEA